MPPHNIQTSPLPSPKNISIRTECPICSEPISTTTFHSPTGFIAMLPSSSPSTSITRIAPSPCYACEALQAEVLITPPTTTICYGVRGVASITETEGAWFPRDIPTQESTIPSGRSSSESMESNTGSWTARFSFELVPDYDVSSRNSFDSLDPFGEARDGQAGDQGESSKISLADADVGDSQALLAQTLNEERKQATVRAAAEWFACADRSKLASNRTQQQLFPKQETKRPKKMSPKPRRRDRVKTAVKDLLSRGKKDGAERGGYAGL